MLCDFRTASGILRMFWNEVISMYSPLGDEASLPHASHRRILHWCKPRGTMGGRNTGLQTRCALLARSHCSWWSRWGPRRCGGNKGKETLVSREPQIPSGPWRFVWQTWFSPLQHASSCGTAWFFPKLLGSDTLQVVCPWDQLMQMGDCPSGDSRKSTTLV